MRTSLRPVVLAGVLIPGVAQAEAALADLVFLLPQAVLTGIYWELSRPWVLPTLWGMAAICWVVYLVTGHDVVGNLLDWLRPHGRSWIDISSHGACTLLASLCSIYVMAGWAISGPPQDPASPRHRAVAQAPAPAPPLLPYPIAATAAYPHARWPTSSGMLPGSQLLAYGGRASVILRNPGDAPLWVRLCSADLDACHPLRQAYITARHHYFMERVREGRYRVEYTQVTGPQLSGVTPVLRVEQDPSDMYRLDLSTFAPAPVERSMRTPQRPSAAGG
ncbi:hypothetical protein [Acidovorax sp. RAC01]|uniref:hypothetical protein n=1 Tax=Acidovorax sp. RAC01 TaxID=1842533 RepID=UPI00083E7005|nr:hypothetical protein [Acidovorax sp. RAC01]AOG25221.1 hypothetical protein BSY15_3344 [Acidovorax sp. RAC01]